MSAKGDMAGLKFILYALVLVLFLVFIIQNYATLTASHSLRLNIVLANLETVPLPFYLIALILFFLGFLLAMLLQYPRSHRAKKDLKETKLNHRRLEEQLNQLRRQTPPSAEKSQSPGPAQNGV